MKTSFTGQVCTSGFWGDRLLCTADTGIALREATHVGMLAIISFNDLA